MKLKKIQEIDLTGKRILLRCDYNVSVDEKGKVKDLYKIQVSKKTVDYIMSFSGVKLCILTHLGRPKGKKDNAFKVAQMKDEIETTLQRSIRMACDCIGVCVSGALEEVKEGEVILLENVRFHKEEKEGDTHFASQLAAPFDIYVGDAFGVSHRKHASVAAITQHIPSYAGLVNQAEVEALTKIKADVKHPAVAVIGGSKIETKIPLISMFEKDYDHILVGGRTSVEAIDAKMTFSQKVVLPKDFTGKERFDIGEKTTKKFVETIKKAQTIVWNGPLGKFEEAPYDKSTLAVADAIANNREAYSVVGGGESVQAVTESGHFGDISFVSTGGGAMLAFLSGDKMPGLTALEE